MSQWNGEPGLHRVMEATLEFEAGALGSKKNSSSGAHSRGSSMTKLHQEAEKTWRLPSFGHVLQATGRERKLGVSIASSSLCAIAANESVVFVDNQAVPTC